MSETQLLLVGAILALGLGYLLLKFGQAIARFLLILGGLIVAGIIGLAFLEQARATRAVATTASIAATGQAATSASISAAVILILILLLAGVGVATYFYLRRRQASQAKRTWLPGPYAYWGQYPVAGPGPGAALPAQPYSPAQPHASLGPWPYPATSAQPVVYYLPYPPYPYPAYPAVSQTRPEEDDEPLALPWWE